VKAFEIIPFELKCSLADSRRLPKAIGIITIAEQRGTIEVKPGFAQRRSVLPRAGDRSFFPEEPT